MRHIAPIDCVIGVAVRSVGIAEDESKHVSAIDHSFEVTDLRFVGRIPRAIEDAAVLLHAWNLAVWPDEGKVSQINCRPESDEEQKSGGISTRHGSYVVVVRVPLGDILSEEGSWTAATD